MNSAAVWHGKIKQQKPKDTEPFLCHYIKIVLLQKYKLGLLIRQLISGSTQESSAKGAIKKDKLIKQVFFFVCFAVEKEEMSVK